MRSAMCVTEADSRFGLGVGGRRRAALVVSMLGAVIALGGPCALSAQMTDYANGMTPDVVAGPHARRAVVRLADGRLTVSRQAGRPVTVLFRTDSGTFVLAGDSSIIARWADSAATLPEVSLANAGKRVSFKMWQLHAEGDTSARMRFARLPTAHGSVLALALSNGAWGIVENLSPDIAADVLDALRGVNTPMTADSDDTELGRAARLGSADAYKDWPDTGDVLSLRTADTTYRPVEKQARFLRGGPKYPPGLVRAGITGETLMQFVIDTTGHAEMPSLRMLATNELHLARVSRDALPSMLFIPAEVDGRKVRELVQLPFTFKIQH
jgi:hypothetical protein